MAAEPRTQREIMAALHMPVPQRNCCTDLLDDGGSGRGGIGARHVALVAVTFTFSVICLSLLRPKGGATSTSGGAAGGGGSQQHVMAPGGMLSSEEAGALPLHYLEESIGAVLLVPMTATRSTEWSVASVAAAATEAGAGIVGFVGAHTPEDTQRLLKGIKQRGGSGHYVLSVAEGEAPQQHENLFADSTYFSVISKRSGFEVLSARSERVGAEASAISGRLRKTPFGSLLLLTQSVVPPVAIGALPGTTLSRLVLAHEEEGRVVLRKGSSAGRPTRCDMGIVRHKKGKGMPTFECFGAISADKAKKKAAKE